MIESMGSAKYSVHMKGEYRMKMLEVRIIVADDVTDEQLNEAGLVLQEELPAASAADSFEILNITYEIKPVPQGQAV
jgi:hypothetical protein